MKTVTVTVLALTMWANDCGSKTKQTPLSGCDQVVQQKCGTNPFIRNLDDEMRITQLPSGLVKEAKGCVNASADIGVKTVQVVKGEVKACIERTKTVDEGTRDKLFASIDKIRISDDEYNGWVKCKLQACAERPVVVVMDSHLPGVVYCKQTRDEGGSNADDIKNLVAGLPIRVDIIPTSLAWQDYSSVLERKPVLVIVHASAFYAETKEMEGNTRLLTFLDALKGSTAKVLVYTRGLSGQDAEGVLERWKRLNAKVGEVKGVKLFVMPQGQKACFRDPEDGGPFQNEVKAMLGL